MLPEIHIATFMNLRLAPEAADLITARQYRELEERAVNLHPYALRSTIRSAIATTETGARRALARELDSSLRRFVASDNLRRQVFQYEIATQRIDASGYFWSMPAISVGGWRSTESELQC